MCRALIYLGKLLFVFKKRKLPKNIKKVLLLKVGAMGDVLMTTPLLRALSKKGYEVDYAVGKKFSGVLEGNKSIHRLITFDESFFYKKKLFKLLELSRRIKKQNYDLIFVLDKSWLMAVFAFLCGKFRIGFDRYGEGFANNKSIPYGPVKHDVRYYMDLSNILNVHSNDTQIEINLSKSDFKFADGFFTRQKLTNKKVIGIIPGGAKNVGVGDEPIRRWDVENFVLLCKKLIQKNYFIVLLGGPGDFELNEFIITRIDKKNMIFNKAGIKIKQSAAIMKKCKWIVCNDSGPMHIASAVNKQIISLFGPTNPKRKAPLHKESVAIWKDQKIYEKEYEIFGKSPKRADFMRNINVSDVMKVIR